MRLLYVSTAITDTRRMHALPMATTDRATSRAACSSERGRGIAVGTAMADTVVDTATDIAAVMVTVGAMDTVVATAVGTMAATVEATVVDSAAERTASAVAAEAFTGAVVEVSTAAVVVTGKRYIS